MKKIALGPYILGEVPLVVGTVSSPRTIERPLDIAALAMDVVEFRVDLFGPDTPDWLARAGAIEAAGLPVLLTARHAAEGGHWFLGEEERVAVYRSALPYVSAIDVEVGSASFAALAAEARSAGKVVVGSFHDFAGTPDEATLRDVVRRGRAGGADVVKIAALTPTRAEVDRLAALLDSNAAPHLCVLGMGPLGGATRVELARRGSCLTYGFFDEANAPGQLSSQALREQLAGEDARYAALIARRRA
jgi:3-dehydroquinate dehydratase-1